MDITRKPPKINTWQPDGYDFKAWAFDVVNAANSYTPTAGTAVISRIKIEKPITIDNAHFIATSSGAGLSNVFAAIYQNGELLSQSDNVNTNFQSPGGKTIPFSTPVVIKRGYVDVVLWQDGTTPANIARGSQLSGISDFLLGQDRRFATADTGLTDTAPATLGSKAALNAAVWCALS